MQVAIVTGSRTAECKMLSALDVFGEANVSIEAKLLDKTCTKEELKIIVEDLLGDVILVGSSQVHTLGPLIANFSSNRLTIGVLLDTDNDVIDICNSTEVTKSDNFISVPTGDVKSAAKLALQALEKIKKKQSVAS